MCVLDHVRLFVTPWTVAREAPLSMGFPRHEYWSGLPFPPPGNLPDPGVDPMSPASPTFAGGPLSHLGNAREHESRKMCKTMIICQLHVKI